MVFPRKITGRLIERFIFNFRMSPERFARHLPATWLRPQVVSGFAVASFCILKLDEVTVWPIPGPAYGRETISVAYRCGVIDTSSGSPEPSVYITDRNTDLPLIARLAPLLLADTIPTVNAAIARAGDDISVHVSYLDGQHLFAAEARPSRTPMRINSEVFESLDHYIAFIKSGVSSYTPSVRPGYLARVDLHKEDAHYEAIDAEIDFSWLDGAWRDAGLVFDSAVRAGGGGRYEWSYRGLVPIDLHVEHHGRRAQVVDLAGAASGGYAVGA